MNLEAWHVIVAIPARNEERLLARCLKSVVASFAALPKLVTFDLVVAVDSSTDRTWEIAKREVKGAGVVIRTDAGAVGHARAIANQVALDRYAGAPERCWLANTDADCIVPKDWLRAQLSLAATNVHAVAGTIDVDNFDDHDPIVQERFRNTYLISADGSHHHVHGANLGVRADVYLQAGGWRNLLTAEDHDLWNRLSKLALRKVSSSKIQVVTSGRRIGRAPHGFAEALAAHNETAA